MKNLLLIFSVLLSTSLSAVEYGQMGVGDVVELENGDIFEVLSTYVTYNYSRNGNIMVRAFNSERGIFVGAILASQEGYNQSTAIIHNKFVGPATVSLSEFYGSEGISYKLTRASEYQNSNVFSVIGDSSSTHNIIVETSTDLENWTPVHSSGITGSSEQIYVRTRISTSE